MVLRVTRRPASQHRKTEAGADSAPGLWHGKRDYVNTHECAAPKKSILFCYRNQKLVVVFSCRCFWGRALGGPGPRPYFFFLCVARSLHDAARNIDSCRSRRKHGNGHDTIIAQHSLKRGKDREFPLAKTCRFVWALWRWSTDLQPLDLPTSSPFPVGLFRPLLGGKSSELWVRSMRLGYSNSSTSCFFSVTPHASTGLGPARFGYIRRTSSTLLQLLLQLPQPRPILQPTS
ncbi:hypothetical protein K505DRAFT_11174 [Melanomma pulvis-pyrius CBS 109.77]|uniref:Uncharacterized protein n=1 Tax=Melanomma pulvis-pyrius CBS 109.77 TaxID=1314802 RepID=A0A6A6WN74_9PLEO|nr:hypothetical protein K505DRAFT_11174 [Melanomma pulvis-pyrius CBS 109.77]